MGPAVVPGSFAGIHQDPQESEPQYHPGDQGPQEPDTGRRPTWFAPIDPMKPQAPGFHTEGLSPMSPEPAEEEITDQQQIDRFE